MQIKPVFEASLMNAPVVRAGLAAALKLYQRSGKNPYPGAQAQYGAMISQALIIDQEVKDPDVTAAFLAGQAASTLGEKIAAASLVEQGLSPRAAKMAETFNLHRLSAGRASYDLAREPLSDLMWGAYAINRLESLWRRYGQTKPEDKQAYAARAALKNEYMFQDGTFTAPGRMPEALKKRHFKAFSAVWHKLRFLQGLEPDGPEAQLQQVFASAQKTLSVPAMQPRPISVRTMEMQKAGQNQKRKDGLTV